MHRTMCAKNPNFLGPLCRTHAASYVACHCDDSNWTHEAKTILEETGAEDVSSTGEARADFARTDKPLPRRRVHDEA
jgi:hypothetical protein